MLLVIVGTELAAHQSASRICKGTLTIGFRSFKTIFADSNLTGRCVKVAKFGCGVPVYIAAACINGGRLGGWGVTATTFALRSVNCVGVALCTCNPIPLSVEGVIFATSTISPTLKLFLAM